MPTFPPAWAEVAPVRRFANDSVLPACPWSGNGSQYPFSARLAVTPTTIAGQ
ncbi:MAG: hypothetical protein IT377_04570 [Polyangiaceae bacterium]|nr:hypothetical protein [Polyangiaceae bacterium]